jgi:hypothetical protein
MSAIDASAREAGDSVSARASGPRDEDRITSDRPREAGRRYHVNPKFKSMTYRTASRSNA